MPGVFPGPRVLWSLTFVTVAGRGFVDFRGFPGVYLLWGLCGLLGDRGLWLSAWLGVSVGVGGGGVRSWRYRDLFDYVGDGSAPALPANFLGEVRDPFLEGVGRFPRHRPLGEVSSCDSRFALCGRVKVHIRATGGGGATRYRYSLLVEDIEVLRHRPHAWLSGRGAVR